MSSTKVSSDVLEDGAVTTAKLSPQAVKDLAGLSLVQGDVLYHDGTNLVRLPKGSNGDLLTMGASVPGWVAPAGSGWEFLTSQTAAGRTIDFTGLGGYTHYRMFMYTKQGDTGGGNKIPFLQIGYGAGPTWRTSNYIGPYNTDGFYLSNGVSLESQANLRGIINIFNASKTLFNHTLGEGTYYGGGSQEDATALTAIRLDYSGGGGNWSGDIYIYGHNLPTS